MRLDAFKGGATAHSFAIMGGKANLIVAKASSMEIFDGLLGITSMLKGADDGCAIAYWHESLFLNLDLSLASRERKTCACTSARLPGLTLWSSHSANRSGSRSAAVSFVRVWISGLSSLF